MFEVWFRGERLIEVSEKGAMEISRHFVCLVDKKSRTVVLW